MSRALNRLLKLGLHTNDGGAKAALFLDKATTGKTWKRQLFTGYARELVVSVRQPMRKLVFEQCAFVGRPTPAGEGKVKWGARLYDAQDVRFIDCVFEDLPLEHGAYINAAGDVTFEGCTFENIGAQAVQTAFRASETSNPAWAHAPGVIRVTDCVVNNCGQASGAGRAGFALSFKSSGQAVVVRGVKLTSHQPTFRAHGGDWNSYGAICAEDVRSLEVERCVVDYVNPDRPAIQAARVPIVVVEAAALHHAARIKLEDCGGFRIAKVRGIGPLIVDGANFGTVAQGGSV